MNNRRTFIKQSALVSAGLFISPHVFSYQGSPADKVILGIAGVNSRGLFHAQAFSRLPNVEVAYICDVDELALAKAIAAVEMITGKKPQGFKDVRKMLEVKDMDAITIAAPDHWHAPATMLALKAGKHVYVEKPCSHNPAEGEMLVQGMAKYKKLVQMGSQRRSFPGVMEAMQSLKGGVIGRVYFAKGWYANARKSIGIGKLASVPATLDYELWQGPAPRKPYKDNLIHYNWHWFWNWGTGEALNNGTHELDVMRWGLGVDFPTKVVSAGGRFAFKDDWETPDTQTISYEFANNTAMTWEGRSCNDLNEQSSGRGVIFYGEKGSMVIPGGDDYKIYSLGNKLIKEVTSTIQQVEATNTVSIGEKLERLHFLNFVDSVREKATLNCPIAEGYKSTLLPQLGNIAFRTTGALHCDPVNGHIKNNKEAQALWSREYEKGWEMTL